MKKVTSAVTYAVPHWNFCNIDNINERYEQTGAKCKFCQASREGHVCLLYNKALMSQDGMVYKVKACCEATAGFESTVDSTAPRVRTVPTIPPQELMKQTIELYETTVTTLMSQGYPRKLATTAAKKDIIGGK